MFAAARVDPACDLRDLSDLLGQDERLRSRYVEALARSETPHRAAADAERIGKALLGSMGIDIAAPSIELLDADDIVRRVGGDRLHPPG